MFSPKDFVHLHVHSEYSLLDGASRVKDIVGRAKGLGMDAVAITDHGNMCAAVKFYKTAKDAGIHPIIGCETYLARRSRLDKTTKEDRSPYHLTLLAKDETGYKNLIRLVTLSNIEGFYMKPQIDMELLGKYNKGLVAMSGCLGGKISQFILDGEEEKAEKAALEFKELFGDDYYLELMNNNLPEQMPVTKRLIELSKKLSIPVVATNDSHYTERKDARAQDVLLCIGTGRFVDEESRMKFMSEEFYIKTPDEMAELFADIPEAIKNTRLIADKCDFKLPMGNLYFPDFPVPQGKTLSSFLKELAEEGIRKRYGSDPGKRVTDRLEEELGIIDKMGYAPFFLIVQDFINYAKRKGIEVGPGRGSAAGSIVSYALGITEIEPLKYDLIFERFLNLERVTMPDIDTDFCFERRQEVIDYVTQKYGSDHVAQIITFGTMGARAVIRDVGRVLRVPLTDVDRIAKMVPVGPDASIDSTLDTVKEFKTVYNSDPSMKNLIDTAKTLEGLTRHASVHAAGVVISQKPLTEYVPLQVSGDSQVVTQYSMKELENVGLLKMDFLGLRNLTMIAHAVSLVEKNTGKKLIILEIPTDDEMTFDLLSRGETIGIFQLESQGMRNLIKSLKPNRFEDIIALNALYRPGPLESGMAQDFVNRKNGLTVTSYELKELEPILKETYGVILYQEQVMKIASAIAGFTMGEADVLRWAMGKKNPKEMARQREKFMAGSGKKGFSHKKAKDLFDLCEKFAGYGFNKSHSTAYSLISYQTAYLKAHYPVEFMAALLTSIIGDTDKVSFYITEAGRMGIKVLPPDINESEKDFSAVNGCIRFGIAAVKNVGFGAIDAILANRASSGPFRSFKEFASRIDSRLVNKKVTESLIKCGAFDSLGESRAGLLSKYEDVVAKAGRESSALSKGQTTLFGEEVSLDQIENENSSDVPEFSKDQILRMEKEMLGLYISDHPLRAIEAQLNSRVSTVLSELPQRKPGSAVTVGGLLKNPRKITTRKNDLMMVAELEDMTGSVNVVFFPKMYEKYSYMLTEDVPIIVKGKVDVRNDDLQVIGDEAEVLDKVTSRRGFHIEIKPSMKPDDLARVKTTLAMFRGEEPTFIHINGKIISAEETFPVAISSALVENIEMVTGASTTWIDFEETAAKGEQNG